MLPFLRRVVDSLLNHLALSSDNRRIERLAQDEASSYGGERIAFQDGAEGPWPLRPEDFNAAGPSEFR